MNDKFEIDEMQDEMGKALDPEDFADINDALYNAYSDDEDGYRVDEDDDRDPNAKFPDAIVKISGVNGNAFSVMGSVLNALRRAGATVDEMNEYKADAMSSDYNHLLLVSMQWVSFA